MDIDALGTFNMCRSAYPLLVKAAGGGCIINISATLHYGATFFQAHACAAKAAIDSLTRTLALEWGANGIRVNAIAPGPTAGTAGRYQLLPACILMLWEFVSLEAQIVLAYRSTVFIGVGK